MNFRKYCVAVILAGLSTSAFATEYLDDSASAIDPTVLTAIEEAAKTELRDPNSLQIRGLTVGDYNGTKLPNICGFINAKNGFGGYAGFHPFFYDMKEKKLTIYQEDPGNEALNELVLMTFKYAGCKVSM